MDHSGCLTSLTLYFQLIRLELWCQYVVISLSLCQEEIISAAGLSKGGEVAYLSRGQSFPYDCWQGLVGEVRGLVW